MLINNYNDVDNNDSLDLFLKEVNKQRLLTYEEEVDLFKRLQEDKDDNEAKQILANSNLRLVISIAKDYRNLGVEFLDLIQEGNIGLLRAIDLYDVNLGYKFSTFATPRIFQKVLRALAEKTRLVRVPVHISEKLDKIRKLESKFEMENGRLPTDDEMADMLDNTISAKKVHELKNTITSTISLDTPVGEDKEQVVGDLIADTSTMTIDNRINEEERNERLHLAISKLSEIEQFVINHRFGFNKEGKEYTLDEIGREINKTKERVRQIEKQAKSKLAKMLSE